MVAVETIECLRDALENLLDTIKALYPDDDHGQPTIKQGMYPAMDWAEEVLKNTEDY